jgi:DNA segregation ATPase FtsK/SpoIIIE-like protein
MQPFVAVARGAEGDLAAIGNTARIIEAMFAAHGVAARVSGGEIAPTCIQFHVDADARADISLRIAKGLAAALQVPQVLITGNGTGVMVAVPRALAAPVLLSSLLERSGALPACTAILGITADERPLLLRLPGPEAGSVLVAGAARAGKSTLLRTVALSLAAHNRPAQLQLLLIDVRPGGLEPLAALPHALAEAATDAVQGGHLVTWLRAEMDRRDQEGYRTPRIACLLDGLEDVLAVGGASVEDALVRLALRGREVGLHLIAATRMPACPAISDRLRESFAVRLVGCVRDAGEALNAGGVTGSDAGRLLGLGDFVAVAAGGATPFQAAYAPEQILPAAPGASAAEIISGLRGRQARGTRSVLPAPRAVSALLTRRVLEQSS